MVEQLIIIFISINLNNFHIYELYLADGESLRALKSFLPTVRSNKEQIY